MHYLPCGNVHIRVGIVLSQIPIVTYHFFFSIIAELPRLGKKPCTEAFWILFNT